MKAYSNDLRDRVWRACVQESMGPTEASQAFAVSRSFVCKLLRRYREEGHWLAKPRGGNRQPALKAGDLRQLRRLVRQRPDATLAEFCQMLAEHRGVQVRLWTMCRALKQLALPLKKSRFTTAAVTRLVFVACEGLTPAN